MARGLMVLWHVKASGLEFIPIIVPNMETLLVLLKLINKFLMVFHNVFALMAIDIHPIPLLSILPSKFRQPAVWCAHWNRGSVNICTCEIVFFFGQYLFWLHMRIGPVCLGLKQYQSRCSHQGDHLLLFPPVQTELLVTIPHLLTQLDVSSTSSEEASLGCKQITTHSQNARTRVGPCPWDFATMIDTFVQVNQRSSSRNIFKTASMVRMQPWTKSPTFLSLARPTSSSWAVLNATQSQRRSSAFSMMSRWLLSLGLFPWWMGIFEMMSQVFHTVSMVFFLILGFIFIFVLFVFLKYGLGRLPGSILVNVSVHHSCAVRRLGLHIVSWGTSTACVWCWVWHHLRIVFSLRSRGLFFFVCSL